MLFVAFLMMHKKSLLAIDQSPNKPISHAFMQYKEKSSHKPAEVSVYCIDTCVCVDNFCICFTKKIVLITPLMSLIVTFSSYHSKTFSFSVSMLQLLIFLAWDATVSYTFTLSNTHFQMYLFFINSLNVVRKLLMNLFLLLMIDLQMFSDLHLQCNSIDHFVQLFSCHCHFQK